MKVIRAVAKSSAGRVGENVTVTSLPAVAVPTDVGVTMFLEPPDREAYRTKEISQTYNADGSMKTNPPARVSEGIIVGGITMKFGDADPIGPMEGYLKRTSNPPE